MRFLIEAIKDISKSIGDHNFRNKKGETVEVSSGEVETALSPMLDGSYKLVEEIPESDAEKERFKNAEKQERIQADLSQAAEKVAARQDAEKLALGKLPKEALIKKAARLNIEESGTLGKQPLVEKIMETKFGNQSTGGAAVSTTGATASSFATDAQSSQDAVDAAASTTQTTANAGAKQNINAGGKQNANVGAKQNAKASGRQNVGAAGKTTQTSANTGGKQTVTATGNVASAAGQTSNITGTSSTSSTPVGASSEGGGSTGVI